MRRHKHSLSHYHLLSGKQGQLIPIGLLEVLPGDTFRHQTQMLMRIAPMLSPVMHPVQVRVHHWFVPHRLVWEDFEDFITGGEDGLDTSTFPTIDFSGGAVAKNDLADYLGLPIGFAGTANALPFRAYDLIYNEWYRDQQLQTELTIDLTDGADSTTATDLQSVNWEKDPFTSARPSEQLGAEVSLPLGTRADIKGFGIISGQSTASTSTFNETGGTQTSDADGYTAGWRALQDGTTGYPDIYADLSTATAATINQLREAFALQRFAEFRNMYGGRYTEYLRADFNVRSADARLQRPEYIAGGKQTVQFSEIIQSAPSIDDTSAESVGVLKGHGISAMRSNRYLKFFSEHGYVISLMSVRPRTMYWQGTDRHWLYSAKEDLYQTHLEGLGSQEVLNRHVYEAHATPSGTFGYEDRYNQYRREKSRISGDFTDTLDFWHMAREFSSDPALNSTFVTASPTTRIYADTSGEQFYCMAQHSVQARRLVRREASPSRLV